MIKIMIADDQELIRESLRIVLNINPDMEVIGVTENGQETIDLVRAKKPDVILMKMPAGCSGSSCMMWSGCRRTSDC